MTEPTFTARTVTEVTGVPQNTLNSWAHRRMLLGIAESASQGKARRFTLTAIVQIAIVRHLTGGAVQIAPDVAASFACACVEPNSLTLNGEWTRELHLVVQYGEERESIDLKLARGQAELAETLTGWATADEAAPIITIVNAGAIFAAVQRRLDELGVLIGGDGND